MNLPLSREEVLVLQIDRLLQRWPDAASLFLRFRMACLGCEFSRFDTLAEALEAHAVDPIAFLRELDRVIQAAPASGPQGPAPSA